MQQLNYQKYFTKDHWGNFGIEVCKKLRNESVLISGLPASGKRYFLRHIREYYKEITQDNNSLIISFEILPGRTKILFLAHTISESINYELNFPKYLEDLSCEETLKELTKRNKEILIIINRFEWLQKFPETMVFLESLRTIDQFKIRFLICCDITCLTEPDIYRPAGVLTSANIRILPTFNIMQVKRSININNKIYGWDVSQNWAKQIYTLSGGNPGLVKYIVKYIQENAPRKLIKQALIKEPGINLKLINIFKKFRKCKLVKGNNLDLSRADLLRKLSVLSQNNKLKIKLLEPLLETKRKIKAWNPNEILSVQELKVFQLLDSQYGKIFSLDKISEKLWGENASLKYSLWSIYKVISNLNRKLKKFGLEIKNYRGRGYSLIKND